MKRKAHVVPLRSARLLILSIFAKLSHVKAVEHDIVRTLQLEVSKFQVCRWCHNEKDFGFWVVPRDLRSSCRKHAILRYAQNIIVTFRDAKIPGHFVDCRDFSWNE